MKRRLPLLGFLAVTLLLAGCDSSQVVQPGSAPDAGLRATADRVEGRLPNGLMPGAYYSLAADDNGYSVLIDISKRNGLATPGWVLSGREAWVVGEPALGATPLGIAFDVDGTIYTINNALAFERAACRSRFAKVDPATGYLTYIGPEVPLNYCGPDINSKGEFYVMGMEVPHLGYIQGTGKLYRVDKLTGAFTEIGPLDVEYTDWMDLAFDSEDRLWGTTQNKLFRIDPQTGAILKIVPITGVPGDPPPPPNTLIQEVMSIAFDDKDVLYGTAMNVEWDTGRGSPVMRIDTRTGQATLLGYTGQNYNHGGDMMPTKVKVLHRTGNGGEVLLEVSMNALAAHLAHGDVVPGTAGVPWPEGEPVAGRVPGR